MRVGTGTLTVYESFWHKDCCMRQEVIRYYKTLVFLQCCDCAVVGQRSAKNMMDLILLLLEQNAPLLGLYHAYTDVSRNLTVFGNKSSDKMYCCTSQSLLRLLDKCACMLAQVHQQCIRVKWLGSSMKPIALSTR